MKKLFALALTLTLGLMALSAAAGAVTIHDVSEGKVEIISCPGGCQGHVITGTSESTGLLVRVRGKHNVTFRNLNIRQPSGKGNGSPVRLSRGVTLTLEGDNTVSAHQTKNTASQPAIWVFDTLTIARESTGTLNVASHHEYAAAIGGTNYDYNGKVIINGGTISAQGGRGAAAIGSGMYPQGCNGGTIIINGGAVQATSKVGWGSASLGAGGKDYTAQITIGKTAHVRMPDGYTGTLTLDGTQDEEEARGTYHDAYVAAGFPCALCNKAADKSKAELLLDETPLVYNGQPQRPDAKLVLTAEVGGETYSRTFIEGEDYSLRCETEQDGQFAAIDTPADAGTYYLTAYSGDEVFTRKEFVIAKAEPVPLTGVTAVYGQALSAVGLPTGWKWDHPDTPVGDVGENEHTASYAGDANHLAASGVTLMLTVSQSQTTLNAKADKMDYIYGEYVVVEITPAATGVSAFGLRRAAAPAAGTVSLWHGETRLTEDKAVQNGETATFDLSTVAEGFVPGSYTLTAKYGESGNMAAQTAQVSFAVAYAQTEKEAQVSGNRSEHGVYTETPTLTAPEGTTISEDNGPDAAWSDSLPLPEGDGEHSYTYYILLEDGTIARKHVTFTVDTTAPEVAEPTVLVDPTEATITVTATDAVSGVKDIQIKVNSGEGDLVIEGNGDDSYTVTGLIPGETYSFTLIVSDWAGHETKMDVTITAPLMPALPQTGDASLPMGALLALLAASGGMLCLLGRKKA